jgi:hypothetical protein
VYIYIYIYIYVFLGNKGELKSRLQEHISSNSTKNNIVDDKENIQENCNIINKNIDTKNVDKILNLTDSEKIRKNMVHMDAMVNKNNTINYITVNNDDDVDI